MEIPVLQHILEDDINISISRLVVFFHSLSLLPALLVQLEERERAAHVCLHPRVDTKGKKYASMREIRPGEKVHCGALCASVSVCTVWTLEKVGKLVCSGFGDDGVQYLFATCQLKLRF